MFTTEISDQLKNYVYRLIDPRNGETFYVGKGKGNRVFAHVDDSLGKDGDETSEKLRRVREIKLAGLEVSHVIHRHGLDNQTALEVEAALIDAYSGTTNIAGGLNNSERGAMHAREIIEKFSAPIAVFKHPVVAITINRTSTEKSVYEAVRYAWKLSEKRANKAQYVVAVLNGLVIGVFRPSKWMAATPENFPGTGVTREGRFGFEGTEATEDIKMLYFRKRLHDDLRKRGAANPIRYINV